MRYHFSFVLSFILLFTTTANAQFEPTFVRSKSGLTLYAIVDTMRIPVARQMLKDQGITIRSLPTRSAKELRSLRLVRSVVDIQRTPNIPDALTITDVARFNIEHSLLTAAINKYGAIAGAEYKRKAVLWADGVTQKIHSKIFTAHGINDSGDVAVTYNGNGNDRLAGIFSHGTLTPISGLASNFMSSAAINNSSAAVGWFEKRDQKTSASIVHGFFWQNGTSRDIGTLGSPDDTTYPAGINDNNSVVGYTQSAADFKTYPFLWAPNTGMRSLLQPEWTGGRAYAINNAGTIVGNFMPVGGEAVQPFEIKNDVATKLSLPDTFSSASPYAINNKNTIVGQAWYGRAGDPILVTYREEFWRRVKATQTAAVVWRDGAFIDLNRYTPDPNLKLFNAVAVNDSNQIVVHGWHTEEDAPHIYLVQLPEKLPPPLR